MKLSFKTLFSLFFVALIVYGAIWVSRLLWFRPADVDHFYFRSLHEQYGHDAESLSRAHSPDLDKINVYNHKLTDPAFRFSPEDKKLSINLLEQLNGYFYESLSPAQKLSFDILQKDLTLKIENWEFLPPENFIAPFYGIHSQTPVFLAYFHRVRDRQEAHNYLLRLDEVETKVDGLILLLKSQAKQRLLPPRHLLERTLSEVKAFTAVPIKENLVYTSFGKRAILTHYQSYNDGEAARHMGMIEERMKTKVYPAYKRIEKELKGMLDSGESSGPPPKNPSEKAYQSYLKRYSGISIPSDSLKKKGTRAIPVLQKMIQEEILRVTGTQLQSPEDVGPYLRRLTDSLKSAPSFNACEDDLRAIMADAKEKVQGAIPIAPQNPIIHFHPFAAFHAANAPNGFYLPASIDKTREATILLHDGKNRMLSPWKMRTFVYKNLVPGTHWRWTFQLENEKLPLFRRLGEFPDYEAAWSSYSSFLADELGFHQSPTGSVKPHPFSRVAYLQSRLVDAAACVSDPSLYARGWTRTQSITYLMELTGVSILEAERRIDEMIARPGRASASFIGLETILALREKAKTQMGLSYTPAAFHELLLTEGAMPMQVLEKRIDTWIIESQDRKNK